MLRPVLAIFACVLMAGCDSYPRDIEGTLDHVRSQREIRVGLVASGNDAAHGPVVGLFLSKLGTATGATPTTISGAAEPLLIKLEEGELDLVIGQFATDSPWLTDVAVIEPLATGTVADREVALNPVARNGENQWIMLLEREVRDMDHGR